MKYSAISLLALISAVLSAPVHVHHLHPREAIPEPKPEAAVVYVTEVQTKFVDSKGNAITTADATTTAASTTVLSSAPTTTTAASKPASTTSTIATTSSKSSSSDKTTTLSTSAAAKTTSSSSSSSSSGTGSSTSLLGDLGLFSSPSTFEDGKYKCSEFPSGNGVLALEWLGLGGWASIMDLDGNTAETCQDGYYCSYACQAGMSKTQWPTNQPSNGISVGGLECRDGYLYKSNSRSDALCEWGQDGGYAVNNVDQSIALCRTDYPGSENMVVPTIVTAGNTQPISVVNEDNYFTWQGGLTSSQYYVNDAGVSVEDGCVWGTDGSGVGNWAPVVLGAGYTGGLTYLSIIPNPNNRSPPNYNIKIEATEGSTMVGSCSYENGVYSGSGSDGCTVTVTSGSANFVFY